MKSDLCQAKNKKSFFHQTDFRKIPYKIFFRLIKRFQETAEVLSDYPLLRTQTGGSALFYQP